MEEEEEEGMETESVANKARDDHGSFERTKKAKSKVSRKKKKHSKVKKLKH